MLSIIIYSRYLFCFNFFFFLLQAFIASIFYSYLNNKHLSLEIFLLYERQTHWFGDGSQDNVIELFIDFFLKLEPTTLKQNLVFLHELNYCGLILLDYFISNNFNIDYTIWRLAIYSIRVRIGKLYLNFRCFAKILPAHFDDLILNLNSSFPNLYLKNKSLRIHSLKFRENKRRKDISNRGIYVVWTIKVFLLLVHKILSPFQINLQKFYSTPAIAFNIFNKTMIEQKDIVKLTHFERSFVLNAYFGGRCEVYGNPKNGESIYYYDFAGMYGLSMIEKFTTGKPTLISNPDNCSRPGFYCIQYRSTLIRPVLPQRKNSGSGGLEFNNGTNVGCFWFEEIQLFLEVGGEILKIFYGLIFPKFDHVFRDFVLYFNKYRELGNIYKLFAKFMINSLYGRLGFEKSKNKSLVIPLNDLEYYENRWKIDKLLYHNNIALVELETNFNRSTFDGHISFPDFSAAITSKARIRLYRAQQEIIDTGGRLLYSDTDSVFACFDCNSLKKDFKMKRWDKFYNGKQIRDAVFVAPRTYGIKFVDNSEFILLASRPCTTTNFITLKNRLYNLSE